MKKLLCFLIFGISILYGLQQENEKKEETRDVSRPPLRERRLAVIFDSINTNPIFLFRAMPETEEMLKSLSERAKGDCDN